MKRDKAGIDEQLTVYPVRVLGTNVAHLAEPAPTLRPPYRLICARPGGLQIAIERIPLDVVGQAPQLVWCPDCRRYRDYIDGPAR